MFGWRTDRSFTSIAGRRAALGLLLAGALAGGAEAQTPPSSPDDFVAAVGGADQYEILAARLALRESKDPALRAFAEEMIRDHSAAETALGQAAQSSGLNPPRGIVGGDQAPLLAALQSLRGADFDGAYADQQVLAHRQALATEQGYARDGSDPNLRKAAKRDIPMIEHHLRDAEKLKD